MDVTQADEMERAVRERFQVGDTIVSARGATVSLAVIDDRGVVLWVRGESPERCSWECLEKVAARLAAAEPLPRCAQNLSLGWFRALLEAAVPDGAPRG